MDSFKVISFLSSRVACLCQRAAWRGYGCFVAGPGEPTFGSGALGLAASGEPRLWACRVYFIPHTSLLRESLSLQTGDLLSWKSPDPVL